jgi:ribosomal protein S18 acetylase RimI-like enzyme
MTYNMNMLENASKYTYSAQVFDLNEDPPKPGFIIRSDYGELGFVDWSSPTEPKTAKTHRFDDIFDIHISELGNRNQGHGSELLNEAIRILKFFGYKRLYVFYALESSVGFYASFVKTAKHKGLITDFMITSNIHRANSTHTTMSFTIRIEL